MARRILILLVMAFVLADHSSAQNPPENPETSPDAAQAWEFSFSTSGYLVPDDISYASPTFTADHRVLHLEARYNYEAQRTASFWAGYNFSMGETLVFEATPMLGAVCGDTTGIAPGYALSLTYKRLQLSSQGEYVFDTSDSTRSFLYNWNELVYTPRNWFHAGLVSQRTRAYQTPLDIQRGFSAGVSYKKTDFTTYVLNAGWTDPTVILTFSVKF